MLDTLKAWLNGTREYNTGVAIYKTIGTDEKLKALFAQGQTLYANFRLQEELRLICTELKKQKQANPATPAENSIKALNTKANTLKSERAAVKAHRKEFNELTKDLTSAIASINDQVNAIANTISPPNPDLYKACKAEADAMYKQAMNKRAVLFSMVPDNRFEDPNKPDLVAGRKDLALEVIRLYNLASELYDRADHVKLHGRLPDQEAEDIENEVAELQDHEVKPALDNARKAKNKLKGKELTAERIALIQKHDQKIKALEERWHSLKQGK